MTPNFLGFLPGLGEQGDALAVGLGADFKGSLLAFRAVELGLPLALGLHAPEDGKAV